jgi:hypothetical protein
MPVSWVTTAICRGGNQTLASRSTEMNDMASPAPTSTRAAIAPGML